MENNIERKSDNVLNGTTWEFLKTGWWVWHVFAIALVFYLGHLLWPIYR
ncbi:hypothetical protein HM1_0539 [Heliomicrobium modesticaldum Ice1]|uniref:Uncharacterized protein n=2 Tax=Heliomicrobium TaxID=2831443 RepID=B0TFZ6_HELMI|nr:MULTISPECIES: hypothetical protein [Heliomicrobium]ABZ83153.1 hypothetical protein HM1_0539 [Heliomicrobium modesticaldum Ice1]MBM7868135.1 hypothetical protein [Heliomicrobium gestii]MZP44339.1 hypothetical protein [Heliomicrobium gestii]